MRPIEICALLYTYMKVEKNYSDETRNSENMKS